MTRRLFASYIGLVALVLVALVVPLDIIGSRYERQLAASQAQRIATGIALGASADVDAGQTAALQGVADRYRSANDGEIEIFGPGAAVLARVDTDGDNADNDYADLVRAALAGDPSSEVVSDGERAEALAVVPIAPGEGAVRGAVLLELPAAANLARISQLHVALVVFSLAVLALAGLLGIVVARSVARPLDALAAGVDRLGRDDLRARVPEQAGPPELRTLAARFNQMAARLDALVGAQARFVADASHQLRSPLTALRLRLENLEGTIPPATAASLDAEVGRLSRIVDGLLALGRAEAAPAAFEVVQVTDVVAGRVEAWDAYADERTVTLALATGDVLWQAPLVPGDLDQLLDNLLANALQVAPAGSRVVVSLVPVDGDAGGVALHVVDQGPGMTDDERRHAFDRFWQGSRATSGSSGLGLAVVAQLARRNGLGVELAPVSPTGLDAVVTVPAARPQR